MHVCTYVWIWTLNKLKSFQNMYFEVIKQVTWNVIKQLTKQVTQNVLIVMYKLLTRKSSKENGEGNDNPLQYSCLENPMDGGAWWATIPGGSQRVGHDWVTSLSFLSKKIQTFCLQMLIPIFLNHFPSSVETMKRKIYPLFIIPKDFVL